MKNAVFSFVRIFCSSGEGGTDDKDMVNVCVAPPMIVGAWSMAIVLWQLYEYYFYYYVFHFCRGVW